MQLEVSFFYLTKLHEEKILRRYIFTCENNKKKISTFCINLFIFYLITFKILI